MEGLLNWIATLAEVKTETQSSGHVDTGWSVQSYNHFACIDVYENSFSVGKHGSTTNYDIRICGIRINYYADPYPETMSLLGLWVLENNLKPDFKLLEQKMYHDVRVRRNRILAEISAGYNDKYKIQHALQNGLICQSDIEIAKMFSELNLYNSDGEIVGIKIPMPKDLILLEGKVHRFALEGTAVGNYDGHSVVVASDGTKVFRLFDSAKKLIKSFSDFRELLKIQPWYILA